MSDLYEALKQLAGSDRYPFHMPGHKRNLPDEAGFFDRIAKIDITEIEDFDNLHDARGLIEEEQKRLAKLAGVKKSFLLVGGSSAGVMAAICSQTGFGDPIVLARNAHKSAYHGVYVNGLKPFYLYPEMPDNSLEKNKEAGICEIPGPIRGDQVKKMLEKSGAKVVCITSPSYEGILSDIKAIADVVHENGGILIVDEAHGAHLSYLAPYAKDELPGSAATLGADLVIQSLHKTLPTLTQTAVLHICSDRVDADRVARSLRMFQSSSPSYILMASVSHCMTLLEQEGKKLADAYFSALGEFYRGCAELYYIRVLSPRQARRSFQAEFDPAKLVICVAPGVCKDGKPYGGRKLAEDLLRTYHLDTEMTAPSYVLAMTSIMDTQKGFERLYKALKKIDGQLFLEKKPKGSAEDQGAEAGKITEEIAEEIAIMTVRDALDADWEEVSLEKTEGRIAGEFVYRYPPGIPILVPGEQITKEAIRRIEKESAAGMHLNVDPKRIRVLKKP